MKHTYSKYDFSLETLPISPGALSRVLSMSHGDIGRIFEYMAPILYNTPNVRAGKFWFTLVNVSCSHTNFSYGILPKPNDAMLPLNTVWDFTFALNTTGYDEQYISENILRPALNVMVWGNQRGRFLTIGLTPSQSTQFNLRYDMFSVNTLYYTLGALTKNFVLRSKYHEHGESYDVLQNTKYDSYYQQWFMRPIHSMLRSTYFPMLVYNRMVWSQYPFFLSEAHITPQTLMYAFLYCRRIAKLPDVVEDRVLEVLHSSLTNFIQAQDSGEELDDIPSLLYPALVLRKSLPDTHFAEYIRDSRALVPAPNSDFMSHLRKLLYA